MRKKEKTKTKVKKAIFVHNVEIFDSDLLVCVGCDSNDISDFIKSKGGKEFKKVFDDEIKKDLQNAIEGNAGLVFKIERDKIHWYILWLKQYQHTWDDILVLTHELIHYKQFQFEKKLIRNEIEFEAYFIESCLDTISKRILKEIRSK